MLIAIAIAEEIQDCIGARIQRSTSWPPCSKKLDLKLQQEYQEARRKPEEIFKEYGNLWGAKPWVLAPMQSFVILGSLLQWRWQWASIGHFVFLFLCHWVVHIWNCESNKHTAESLLWKEHLQIVQLLGQSQVRIQDLYFPACGQSIHRSPW